MMKLLISNDRKYGILYKGSVFDINSLQEIEGEYTTLKVSKLQHLPNAELDMELIKKLRRKFPYTKIGNTYAFHLNWHQKFFVKINKDNTEKTDGTDYENIFKNLTYSLITIQSYSPLFNPQRSKVSIKVYREIKHLNTQV